MTTPTSTSSPDPVRAAVRASLETYEPATLAVEVWSGLRDEAIDLVLVPEPVDAERARKDLELLALVADHLVRTGVAVSLDSVLADTTLASFDSALRAAGRATGTRENQRGRFRRLQAVRCGLPWRKERRADGERIAALVRPEITAQIAELLPADGLSSGRGAGALFAAVQAARGRRRDRVGDRHDVTASVWAHARGFAEDHGVHLTKRSLEAAVTYEVLIEPVPVAHLVREYALTRRDLDLGLVLAAKLPVEPDAQDRAALRG